MTNLHSRVLDRWIQCRTQVSILHLWLGMWDHGFYWVILIVWTLRSLLSGYFKSTFISQCSRCTHDHPVLSEFPCWKIYTIHIQCPSWSRSWIIPPLSHVNDVYLPDIKICCLSIHCPWSTHNCLIQLHHPKCISGCIWFLHYAVQQIWHCVCMSPSHITQSWLSTFCEQVISNLWIHPPQLCGGKIWQLLITMALVQHVYLVSHDVEIHW